MSMSLTVRGTLPPSVEYYERKKLRRSLCHPRKEAIVDCRSLNAFWICIAFEKERSRGCDEDTAADVLPPKEG